MFNVTEADLDLSEQHWRQSPRAQYFRQLLGVPEERDQRMFKVKAFCGDKIVIDWRMASVPNVGEEVRFRDPADAEKFIYYKITKIVVCLDEDATGERVNLGLEKVE